VASAVTVSGSAGQHADGECTRDAPAHAAPDERRKVITGVDTHKHVHVAMAIDVWRVRLEDRVFPADSGGSRQLIAWAFRLGQPTPLPRGRSLLMARVVECPDC
jgi:hypothetical protein